MGMTSRLQAAWGALTRNNYPNVSLSEWSDWFTFNGVSYPYGLNQTLVTGKAEEIENSFSGYVAQAYKSNGVIFACMLARLLLFSEARFQFRQFRNGRPGDLFGTPDLAVLEHPWPGGTTGDLLARAIQDADLAGNFFCRRAGDRIRRMRPDWVTIVLGSDTDPDVDADDLDAEVLGYLFHPGGRYSGRDPETLLREEVAHFAPIPDPMASFRGMSWLTPIVREVMADSAATAHKLQFFINGATPNMVVSLDKDIAKQAFDDWVKTFKEHEPTGLARAYKTLYLAAGASVQVVGTDLKQLDFKLTQGAGETRIAAAAGVPPIIVGLSEGLEAATYSNYGQARRRFADGTMRPLWRNFAGSLETIMLPPPGASLWYDDRDIPFLFEDKKDAAEVQAAQAQSIKALTDAGYESTSVVDAVTSGDLTRLSHTGLFSVQLQPPMPEGQPPAATQAGRALAALLEPYLNNGKS